MKHIDFALMFERLLCALKSDGKNKRALELVLLMMALSGCNTNNCGDRGKQEREPKRVDTVYVKYVDGDCVHIENGCGTVIYNKNGDVVYTNGNGNNSSSRNSGTQTWERAVRPQPKPVKKKPVIKPEPEPKPEPVVEPKPEPKPEPVVYRREVHISGTVRMPCNSR